MSAVQGRFQDKDYRNWLSCVNGLRVLRCLLRTFLEDQTQRFHQGLLDMLGTDTCLNKCEIGDIKPKELPKVCELCTSWRLKLLDNHKAQGSSIHWHNCNPQRWPVEKWEAAKVYMPGGHKTHVKFEDFDIAALINLMSQCTHFHRLIKSKGLQQTLNDVTYVRNQVMHSPDFTISSEGLKKHLKKIEQLGRVLKPYAPEMGSLSEEIKKGMGEQSLQEFQQMELLSMQEDINSISASFAEFTQEEGSQNMIEVVGRLWSFMMKHQDLQAALSVQLSHLYWMMEHKKELMQALAKVEQQQETIHQFQQMIEREANDGIKNIREDTKEMFRQQKDELESITTRSNQIIHQYKQIAELQKDEINKLKKIQEENYLFLVVLPQLVPAWQFVCFYIVCLFILACVLNTNVVN